MQKTTLASLHGIDQTGNFTELDLDDVVFGPAVNAPGQAAFTPHYFDYDGVTQVLLAVHSGPAAFDTLKPEEHAKLAWKAIPNHARTVPDLAGMPDRP